jgi:energy-coupling factor transport system substrate-specific component
VFQEHKRLAARQGYPLPSRVAGACAAAALALAAWAALDPARGGIAVLLAALAVLAAGFAWLEGGTMSARDLTLVATLGGLAAAGRVLFAPIPSVQPVTVLVAASGVALGPKRGFAVGAVAAMASNFFLGQGPHTPWQMLAWGGCGLLGGILRPLLRGRLAFAAFTVALGFAFGLLMDLWLWYGFYPHTEAALLARLAAGVPFNIAHAGGNLVLAVVAGPELRRVLERFERRSRTEVVWA